MGGYLVNKFVKQTKVNSWFAHEDLDQVALIEAEPDEGAGCTGHRNFLSGALLADFVAVWRRR